MKKSQVNLIWIVFSLVLLLPLVRAEYTNIRYHISLGNGTCETDGIECDLASVNFLLPKGVDTPQNIKFIFKPDCFIPGLSDVEDYHVRFYCLDGTGNATYQDLDLKPYMCNEKELTVWQSANSFWGTNYLYRGGFYNSYICGIDRNISNVQRIPTEFTLTIDTLGFTTKQNDDLIAVQKDVGAQVITGIGTVFSINLDIWRLLFVALEIVLIILGVIFIFGGIPLIIRTIIKKSTGG